MKGDHVLVHFDSRVSGTEVPQHLQGDPAVTLKLSYLFQGSTEVDDLAITSYLRFSGEYQGCVIPWSAIWSMTSSEKENTVWPEDLPKEVLIKLATDKVKQAGKKIFGGDRGEDQDNNSGAKTPAKKRDDIVKPVSLTEEKKKRQGPHLKRIK